ncbi:unnamed protein product [Meganyctiphanes norvegica]|uniref:Uncharacterized protein n=1 Tax=Meganyctiphanes norvegica TaxID=48144 RepID=A0AAV2QJN7_MEGNR
MKSTSKKNIIEKNPAHQTKQISNRRRSGRQRIAPVEYWNGDNVRYDEDGTLIAIENVGAGTSEQDMDDKQVGRKSSNLTKKPKYKREKRKSDIKSNSSGSHKSSRKRKKSLDIEFSDSIISEPNSIADSPPTKRKKLLREMEPLGEFLSSFCMETNISPILKDSIILLD